MPKNASYAHTANHFTQFPGPAISGSQILRFDEGVQPAQETESGLVRSVVMTTGLADRCASIANKILGGLMTPIPDARDLVPMLRHEASDVKQCFTTFSFQAFIFSSAVLGAIAAYAEKQPALNLISALVSVLVIAVARIGTYKYGTANRNYGFELFVDRISRMDQVAAKRTEATLAIGWEEAMRAWRIVQPTTFRALYVHRWPLPNRPSDMNRRYYSNFAGSIWWDVQELVGPKATYHPGSYLSAMLGLLYIFLVASWVPLLVLAHQVAVPSHLLHDWMLWIRASVALFCVWCIQQALFVDRRRVILERELLSIHSSAIMWEAVVVAHQRAAKRTSHHSFDRYTKALAEEASNLREQLPHVDAWVTPRSA